MFVMHCVCSSVCLCACSHELAGEAGILWHLGNCRIYFHANKMAVTVDEICAHYASFALFLLNTFRMCN